MIADYGSICKLKLKECIEEIGEHPDLEDNIIEGYGEYVQKLVDDAGVAVMTDFLLFCYDYDYNLILAELLCNALAGNTSHNSPPKLGTIFSGINFALKGDISKITKFVRGMQKDNEEDLPFE